MNQLPRHLFAKPPRKNACQDGKIKLCQSWVIRSAVFVTAVGLQNKFPLSSKFKKSWEHTKDLYTTHVLSTSGKHTTGLLVKSFGGCCGSTVFMGASCWQSSNCISAQKIVFVLTELITTVQRWRWTPTMVCAITIPLHSLYQGSPIYGPRAKSNLRSHFTRPQNTFCQ